MIETENLGKTFNGFIAVDDITLRFEQDEEMIFIVGPNGAGKTTFINLLTGYYPPTSGSIRYRNSERDNDESESDSDLTDITDWTAPKRVHNGLVRSFQIANLFEEMTAEENIRTAMLARSGLTKSPVMFDDENEDVEKEVTETLEEFGLAEERNTMVSELAHGDRKIVDVAMAMSLDPSYLFLDEPTAGVQAQNKETIIDRVVEVARSRGVTTIVIEHDMDIVKEYADRLIAFHQGNVYRDGQPEALTEDTELRNVLLGVEE